MANEEKKEVKVPEQELPKVATGSDPSPDDKALESSTPEVKIGEGEVLADGTSPKEDKIPYDKFKKVLDEKNLLSDMLADKVKSYISEEPEEQVEPVIQQPYQYADEEARNAATWKKYIEDGDKKTRDEIKKQTDIQRKIFQDQLELSELAKKPDFPVYANAVKEFIGKNPSYTFTDAYDLIKFRTEGVKEKSEETPLEEVEKAKTGTSTPSPKAETLKNAVDIINAKKTDGTFKYSLEDLEAMLPKG